MRGTTSPAAPGEMPGADAVAGLCEVYKRATRQFIGWLASEVPHKKIKQALVKQVSVGAVAEAAQTLAARAVQAPGHVLADLDTSIRVRREVGRLYARGGERDAKHDYFVEILEIARSALRSVAPPAGPASGGSAFAPSWPEKSPEKSFAGLTVEEPCDAPEPAPSAPLATPNLVGESVRIHGLVSKPELNDRLAFVVRLVPETGRYQVRCDGSDYCLRPSQLTVEKSDEQEDLLGETLVFEASCFLLDLQSLLRDAEAVWDEFARGECGLLAATAMTNACVGHAERLASSLELRCSALSSIEHISCATYLGDTVVWVQRELGVGYEIALGAVRDLAFGHPSLTKITRGVVFGIELGSALLCIDEARNGGVPLHAMDLVHYDSIIEGANARLRANLPTASSQQMRAVVDEVVAGCLCCFAGDDGYMCDDGHFLTGENSLLDTSSFLRRFAAAKNFRPPREWSAPHVGFFGQPWDEETNPASCTGELYDYIGGALPALIWFSYHEMWHGTIGRKGQRIVCPDLKMERLMPLWPMLQRGVEEERSSTALTIAIHVAALSVVRVNGQKRCKRIQVSEEKTPHCQTTSLVTS